MQYLVFKLNLQPAKLIEYKNEKDYLINILIPSMLENVVSLTKIPNKNVYKIDLEAADINDFGLIYNNLLLETEKLVSYYKDILEQYKEKKEIFYSKEFLNLNSNCSTKRRKLEKKYPVLQEALDKYSDLLIDQEIDVNLESKIGTGIVHLRKFYKIKKYINEAEIQLDEPLDISAYYRPKDERILIEINSDKVENPIRQAQFYISYIESFINNSDKVVSKLGKVNINPVYESIVLSDDSYTEISFSLVYPNGNPSLDRHNILKASDAKEAQFTIYGTDDQPLKKEAIEDIVNAEAKKGYLKNIFSKKGKKITATIKRVDTL
ncbi:hypothetical protein FQ085_15065 [Planococcus sp. ANT_H30]|uniref:hypothetical protein n=1 Tax=Planococcus sp. ANT_H30 TaxID=2597347 RepID=UPI0011EE79F4|nr:hypothetical protein [Planococcus sp. ANT_H30]KAA0955246.1 hypothetical protein FQ085_15065 [Planococcus sp. ANT_H30]